MAKLAINGGKPIRTKLFPAQETVGKEEQKAVERVFRNGNLSYYRGSWGDNFLGGPEVQAFESEFCGKFNFDYSIAVNSATSGLQIACGAIGLEPGDEVIVSPWTMTCSATAPMIYGSIPVFADIEYDYFCLDAQSIENRITNKTKAIIIVDLFGQPYNVEEINALADKYGLYIIEDAAQAIGSKYKDTYAGGLGHIGVFSFTQGKHITGGEGGMVVTNSSDLASKCMLIRNHAESVINSMPKEVRDYTLNNKNMLGFNMRMTEIQAAILREQLKKLDRFIELRRNNAEKLNDDLINIFGVYTSEIRPDCTHSYYVLPFFHIKSKVYTSYMRDDFINAVKAELTGEKGRPDKGVPINSGYIKPLYQMPIFHNSDYWCIKDVNYRNYDYTMPIVNKLQDEKFFLTLYHGLPLTESDIKDIVNAFKKVSENIGEL